MAAKDTRGNTKQFSKLAQNVSKPSSGQKIEEPKLTPEQVVAVFRSFGYEPNQNKSNDTGYWSTQPTSSMSKLMGDLKKRRDTDNKTEESLKRPPVRSLSDEDYASLFREYGFSPPDLGWARENLPQEEAKLRSVLEIQRKAVDEALKNELKMANLKQSPEMMPPPAMAGQPPMTPMSPVGGMGGPAPDMNTSHQPFFVGDSALVRLSNADGRGGPGSLWLANNTNKTLRPFSGGASIENMYDDPQAAQNSVVEASTSDLAPGGILGGFKMLGGKYAVQSDGGMTDLEFSPSQLSSRYGKASDDSTEQQAASVIDGIVYRLEKNKEISPSFAQSLKNDSERIGFYINALAYGDYQIGDVLNDIRRLEGQSQQK